MKYYRKVRNALTFFFLALKQKLRIINGKPIIHVIGDSHSLLFQHELFAIHYIGPATAFHLLSNTSSTKSNQKISEILKKITLEDEKFVLFVFGEIDCRIHIYKTHKEKHISLETAIENTAKAYTAFITVMKKQYPNLQFLVFNVVPPGEQGNVYEYPYYPDRKTRIMITQKFNKVLRNMLEKISVPFIEVYEQLVTRDGSRKKEYTFDEIHYSNRIVPFIIKKLQEQQKIHV